MTKRPSEDQPLHYEAIVKTIIEKIGPEGLFETISYVIFEMLAEDETIVDFVVEPRRDH